jgi:hypothetical protein
VTTPPRSFGRVPNQPAFGRREGMSSGTMASQDGRSFPCKIISVYLESARIEVSPDVRVPSRFTLRIDDEPEAIHCQILHRGRDYIDVRLLRGNATSPPRTRE